jgi:glycine dehydrogenase
MIQIRLEAEDIATGKQPRTNNIITNAPHTMQVVSGSKWDR